MIHKENVDLEHAYSQKQCSHFPLRRISHTPHGKKLRNVFSLQTVKLFLQLEEIIVVWNSLGFFATDVLVSWFLSALFDGFVMVIMCMQRNEHPLTLLTITLPWLR